MKFNQEDYASESDWTRDPVKKAGDRVEILVPPWVAARGTIQRIFKYEALVKVWGSLSRRPELVYVDVAFLRVIEI
jgi:hypothetical protein